MNQTERTTKLRQIEADIQTLLHIKDRKNLLQTAIEALHAYQGIGYPKGGTGGTSNEINDPTGRGAIQGDPYANALTEINLQIKLAAKALDAVVRICKVTTIPGAYETKDNRPDVAWCHSCQRGQSNGTPIMSPALVNHSQHHITGPLCRWCYDFNRRHDQLPTIELLEAHETGQRITQAMLDRATISTPTIDT